MAIDSADVPDDSGLWVVQRAMLGVNVCRCAGLRRSSVCRWTERVLTRRAESIGPSRLHPSHRLSLNLLLPLVPSPLSFGKLALISLSFTNTISLSLTHCATTQTMAAIFTVSSALFRFLSCYSFSSPYFNPFSPFFLFPPST